MLAEIGSVSRVPDFIKKVKSGEANSRLMGFGHRVYKSYDPRAKVIKKIADLVFTVTGKNPLLEIALELERIALQDDYFVSRKLYPNVDFYSGLIYQAMGFPSKCSRCSSPSAHRRLDCAVGRDARRPRAENRAAAPDLHRGRAARLRPQGEKVLVGWLILLLALALQAPAAPRFDSNRAWEDLRQLVALGPRPAGSPAIDASRKYIKSQLAAAGVSETDQAWTIAHRSARPHGESHRDDSRREPGPRRHRRPLRHEEDSRVPLRGRERRRIERRVSPGIRPRAEKR